MSAPRPTRNQATARLRKQTARKRRAWLRAREEEARRRHRVAPPDEKRRPKRARIKEPNEPLPPSARADAYAAQNGVYLWTPRQRRRMAKKVRVWDAAAGEDSR